MVRAEAFNSLFMRFMALVMTVVISLITFNSLFMRFCQMRGLMGQEVKKNFQFSLHEIQVESKKQKKRESVLSILSS